MKTDTRARRADAVGPLQKARGQGLHTALRDLLEAELAEAREEMEAADEPIAIWRAQGRAAEARNLLAAITRAKRDRGKHESVAGRDSDTGTGRTRGISVQRRF